MNLFLAKSFEPPLITYNYSNPKEYCLSTILGHRMHLGQLGISPCTGFESPKLLLSLGFLNGYEKNRIIVISQHFAVSKLPSLNALSSFNQSIKSTFFCNFCSLVK